MNRIEKLLEHYCPEGVPFKKLGEFAILANNGVDKKLSADEAEVSLLNYMDIYHNRLIANHNLKMITTASAKQILDCTLRKGDIFITPSSETREDLAKAAVIVEDIEDAVYSYHILRIRLVDLTKIDPIFIAYLFESWLIQKQIMQLSTGMTRYGLTKPKWESLTFPIPDIQIQGEIVKILNTFSDLEDELETELVARRKQFDHFRDQFISNLKTDCDWVPFGGIAKIVRGASPRPIEKYFSDQTDSVPWIKIGDTETGERYITQTAQRITLEGAKKSRRIEPGDFILSNSMSFGRPYISKIRGYIHDGWLAISDFQSSLIPDFLYYVLQSRHIQNEFEQRSNSGSVSNLNAEIVKSVLIPIPGIEQQRKIVEILSKMEDLVISESIGLPAEISARRKQYQYYRDKLLTFKELESA